MNIVYTYRGAIQMTLGGVIESEVNDVLARQVKPFAPMAQPTCGSQPQPLAAKGLKMWPGGYSGGYGSGSFSGDTGGIGPPELV